MADASSPALRLPADVLLHLGAFFRPHPTETRNERRVDRIALAAWAYLPTVCRSWREIFLASPSYWSYVVLPVNHIHPRRLFARARGAPLNVVVEVVDDMSVPDELWLADGLSLLETHSQQVLSISMRNNGEQPIRRPLLTWVVRILSLPLPRLQYLHFHDGLLPPWQRATAITRDITLLTPSLCDISLGGYHRLNWSRTTISMNTLCTLRLAFLSFEHMRGALAYLPHLQSAEIDLGDGQLDQGVDWIPPARSLSWPSLKALTLHCHPGDVPAFWEALDVPSSIQITLIVRHISLHIAAAESRTLLSAALSVFLPNRTGEPNLLMLKHMSVTCVHLDGEWKPRAAFNWYTEDSDVHSTLPKVGRETLVSRRCTTSIITDQPVVSNALGCLKPSLGTLEWLYIDLDNDNGPYIAGFILDYVSHFYALRMLHIRGHENAVTILAFLATVDELYLPSLEELIIEDTDLQLEAGRCLDAYLARRLDATLQLRSLHLLHCVRSRDLDSKLSSYCMNVTCTEEMYWFSQI